ncbi:carbohydrate ABC transporter permease [Mesorhizobium sp. UC22_110]|jgi:ABC-type glycerol-3-phosphate transport system permease component|uniref:carbohydrate ABC transporter permease n=1 Tax=unclassified Mesorhizobium TaxID=325217 RepID=UPI00366B6ED8
MSRRAEEIRGNVVAVVLLLTGGIVMVAPFVWMVSTSLKLPADQYSRSLIPPIFTLTNYRDIWTIMPFHIMLWNSFKIAVIATFGQLLTCSMGAFIFAVTRFRGRDALFFLLLITLMVPQQITTIPQFILFKWLGLYGTQVPMYLPSFLGGAFGTFLLRQYFKTIPIELAEAARIDGASLLTIYWRIYLPLAKPALAAFAIFAFMFSWNDLFTALIYLPSDMQTTTLPVGLALLQQQYAGKWTLMMAAVLISVAPIIIAFLIAQKQFIEGISMSGFK